MHVIEFRSGSYFQNLAADRGGPKSTAQRFDSADDADAFMKDHPWVIYVTLLASTSHHHSATRVIVPSVVTTVDVHRIFHRPFVRPGTIAW